MQTAFHLLSVGPGVVANAVCDALRQCQRCRLSVAASFLDLFAISKDEKVDIAILHHTLSLPHLREACAHIRRTWPTARILVLGTGAEDLDDPLYDELVDLGTPFDKLIDLITNIGADGRSSAPNQLGSDPVGRNPKGC
jgi:hypothetical protein